ncbi:MAG: TolC family protein, partial [Caldiserica bacterium]|nr:TolC family protein [Caldisericota bacterium]
MKKFLIISWILFLSHLAFAEGNLLSLQESISIALGNNPSINIAREKIREAQTDKEKARSNFLPKLYTFSSYTRLDKKKTMDLKLPSFPGYPSMPKPVLSDDKIYDYNLSLSQPLFTGGKLISLYNLQKENLAANQHNFEKVKNDLIF